MADQLPSLDVVSFTAGKHRFAVEARQVKARLPDGLPQAVAVEGLLGLPADAGLPRSCLAIGPEGRPVAVGGPVELERLAAASIFALPPMVAARLSLKGIRGLALAAPGLLLLVDLQASLAETDRDGLT